ncbi:MAG: ParA family protein [Alphaproteobacteria bacterium]
MVITLLNQKGGVGKSTVSYLLACALKAAHVDVSILDLDPQGTLASAARRLGEIPLANDRSTPIVIQDTAGHLDLDNPVNRAATMTVIQESDRILLISEMSLPCVEAAATTAAFLKTYQRPESKALVVWNKVRVGTSTGQQDQSELAKAVGLPGAKNWLPLASCYEDTLAIGYGPALKGKPALRKIIEALALEVLA